MERAYDAPDSPGPPPAYTLQETEQIEPHRVTQLPHTDRATPQIAEIDRRITQLEQELMQEKTARRDAEADAVKLKELVEFQQSMLAEVEHNSGDAYQDRVPLCFSLHSQNEDRSSVLAGFDLVNSSVDSWCSELTIRIVDSIPSEGDLTLEHISDRSRFRSAIPNGQHLSVLHTISHAKPILLEALLAHAFSSIVIQRLRYAIFAPFHPSLAPSMTSQFGEAELACKNAFLLDLAAEIRSNCNRAVFRQWRETMYKALDAKSSANTLALQRLITQDILSDIAAAIDPIRKAADFSNYVLSEAQASCAEIVNQAFQLNLKLRSGTVLSDYHVVWIENGMKAPETWILSPTRPTRRPWEQIHVDVAFGVSFGMTMSATNIERGRQQEEWEWLRKVKVITPLEL